MLTLRRVPVKAQTPIQVVTEPTNLREAILSVMTIALAESPVPPSAHSFIRSAILRQSDAQLEMMARTVIGVADGLRKFLPDDK